MPALARPDRNTYVMGIATAVRARAGARATVAADVPDEHGHR
ncbi:MAG: hypothetical protein U0164_12750 [Gemmatimonadaceae bacterium]